MSFSSEHFVKLAAGTTSPYSSSKIFAYKTEDTVSQILATDYFAPAANLVHHLDRIYVTRVTNRDDDSETFVEAIDLIIVFSDNDSVSVTPLGTVLPPIDPGSGVPGTPTNVTVSETSPGVVPISWTYNSAIAVTLFYILRDGSDLNSVPGNQNVYVDTTAPPGDHTYKVQAFNAANGRGTASAGATITVTAPVATVDTPTSVVADPTETTIGVSWAYSGSNPNNHDGFYVELLNQGEVHGFAYLGKAARTYSFNPVIPATDYVVRVAAYKSGTTNTFYFASDVPVTTDTPVVAVIAPTNVTVPSKTDTSFTINWDHTGTAPNYFTIRLTGPNGAFVERNRSAASRSLVFPNLLPNTTYSIVVSAVSVDGLGVATLYSSTPITDTTSTGTSAQALAWATDTQYNVTGVAGTSLATTSQALQTTGGVPGATIQFSILSGPSGLTIGSTTGIWTWASPSVLTNQLVVVQATDGISTITGNFSLTIAPTALSVSRPSGVTAGSTIVITGSVSFTKTWTASGAVGPYTVVFNGQLPSSITPTTTSPSLVLAGTSTQAFSTTENVNVTITSADGQIFSEDYIIQFNTAVVTNSPPVFSSTPTQNQVATEGVAKTLHTFAATDPNGDSVTLKLESCVSQYGTMIVTYSDPVYTVAALGLTFNKNTGVMAITAVEGIYGASGFQAVVSADDGVNVSLQATSTIASLFTSGVSTAPSGVGIVLSGGSGTYTSYSKTGTAPTWLGSFSTSTGLFTGGSGTITDPNAVYDFTLTGNDNAGASASVDIHIEVLAASTDDFVARVSSSGYWRATNFQKVFINGIEDTTRTITSLGSSSNRGPSYKGTLWGEAAGSGNNADHITWEDDPTGTQAKVLMMEIQPGDTTSSGAYPQRLDGTLTNTNSFSGGTVFNRCYYQWRFFAPREAFAYRDPTTDGQLKLGYLGTGFVDGETMITLSHFTGFLKLQVDNAGNNSLRNVHTDDPSGLDPHFLPGPNPWHSSTTHKVGDIIQESGQWAKPAQNGRPAQTVNGSPPTGTSAADKDAYYEYYGFLEGSSKGLITDTSGYGQTGVNGSGVITPWLDERVHVRNGEEKHWPDDDAKTNCPYIHVGHDNTLQLFFERDPITGLGYVMAWHSYDNQPFQLIGSGPVDWGFSADALNSHKIMQIMLYDTNRKADSNRPTIKVPFKEMISSPIPIKGPGGHLPPFNPG